MLSLTVTEPSLFVEARTQSYRVLLSLDILVGSSSEESSSGSSEDDVPTYHGLDSNLFVVQEQECGVVDFLRVAEPRDMSLPLVGPLRRVSDLDLYLTSPITASEMIPEIVKDLEGLVSAYSEL